MLVQFDKYSEIEQLILKIIIPIIIYLIKNICNAIYIEIIFVLIAFSYINLKLSKLVDIFIGEIYTPIINNLLNFYIQITIYLVYSTKHVSKNKINQ